MSLVEGACLVEQPHRTVSGTFRKDIGSSKIYTPAEQNNSFASSLSSKLPIVNRAATQQKQRRVPGELP